jgi:hypothetical protein
MNTNLMMSAAVTSILLTGCVYGENSQFFEDASGGLSDLPSALGTVAVPSPTPSNVCNPFGNAEGGADANSGIKGKMYYYNAADIAKYPATNVGDFYQYGQEATPDFYFDNFYVPTRTFSQGFQLEDGSLLSTDDGTELFEWFAFKFESSIQLPAGSGTKMKQFAIMSDDGSNLLVQDPLTGAWTKNVSNDGQHSSLFGCGGAPVKVSSDFATPIELQYFQGPRYEIALVLLWRDWDADASFNPNDPWCGQSGNSLFFNEAYTPSQPSSAWLDVLSRWEVVPANVFHLNEGTNPCNTQP